jgi:hypothetical protein
MLVGNQLQELPYEMMKCGALKRLRLSANRFVSLPPWLFHLSGLAYLSFAGNPCVVPADPPGIDLPNIAWSDLEVSEGMPFDGILEGIWHQREPHGDKPVWIKLFHNAFTIDGCPADEEKAWLAVLSWIRGGRNTPSLPRVIGRIHGHPEENYPTFYGAIVMEPSRNDGWPGVDGAISMSTALAMLARLAETLDDLHALGISHGHIHPAQMLLNMDGARMVLPSMSTATVYGSGAIGGRPEAIQGVEVQAFGLLM